MGPSEFRLPALWFCGARRLGCKNATAVAKMQPSADPPVCVGAWVPGDQRPQLKKSAAVPQKAAIQAKFLQPRTANVRVSGL